MTNEQKAKGIVDNVFESGFNTNRSFYDMAYNSALKVAKWKDEQFSKFLLWLDDNYVIRRFTDGEPMNYAELIDNFKSME